MEQSGEGNDPQEDYFNDLNQQSSTNKEQGQLRQDSSGNDAQPKAKRIACVLCRKRKLRCDGARPTCGTCKRLAHDCAYDEVRKKSGPKRGYVKLLEARLQQVETLLKSQDPSEQPPKSTTDGSEPNFITTSQPPFPVCQGSAPGRDSLVPPVIMSPVGGSPREVGADAFSFGDTNMASDGGMNLDGDSFPWEMIGLGLEEPLPPQDTIDDLHRIYFEKIHPSLPMIHKGRYLNSCNLAPQMRPPICLRYAMWCNAASVTDRYESLTEHFYHRARKYAQLDEMKGHGEGILSVQHCQAWILLCLYEFKNMYFPRAWQSTGRGVRMAQMLGLQRVDGSGLDVKQCLPPPKDWIEREERRRTFWMAFCEDRYASVGTGWPMTLDERDIMSNLPASESAFDTGKPEPTITLDVALKPNGASKLSPVGGVIIMSCMFGRNLLHLHRPTPDDKDDDLNGEFWRRHRRIEGILSHTSLSLPDHLRLPAGLPDPNVVFMNMAIHTSAICLHQAAIFKADKYKLPANVGSESRVRCVTAAAEIARIMRMLSHLDLSSMNPFLAFCLYVAARVFVQYLKFRPKDEQMISSLQFLLAAMNALKRKNPLTESFLVQLDVDLEGMGIDVGQRKPDYQRGAVIPHNTDSVNCSTIFEVRDSQSAVPTFGRENTVPTFGENGLAQNSAPRGLPKPTESPGPPFHVASTNLNLDVTPGAFSYLNGTSGSSPSMQYQLPNREQRRPGSFGIPRNNMNMMTLGESLSPPESEEGRSPNNIIADQNSTRSNSYKDSSSHTSFTPPSNDETQSQGQSFQNNINSPLNRAGSIPTPGSTASSLNNNNNNNNFFGGMDTSFSDNFQFNQNSVDATNAVGVLPMDGSWTMSGIELTTSSGSGMTPMSDQPWSQMLEGVQDWGGGFPTDQLYGGNNNNNDGRRQT